MPAIDSIGLDTVVVVAKDQVHANLPEEVVILNVRDGAYFGLNRTAARVWELLERPRSVREIRDTLLNEYEVEVGPCTEQLMGLIVDLHASHLLETVPGAPPVH